MQQVYPTVACEQAHLLVTQEQRGSTSPLTCELPKHEPTRRITWQMSQCFLASTTQYFILTAYFLFSSFSQMKSLKTLQIFGLLNTEGIEVLRAEIPNITVNKSFFSMIARPVGSVYYGTIWGVQCKG